MAENRYEHTDAVWPCVGQVSGMYDEGNFQFSRLFSTKISDIFMKNQPKCVHVATGLAYFVDALAS